MKLVRTRVIFGDLGVLALLAVGRLVLHTVTNSQYGFHRDELAMLDDARYLAWGYVAYPPMTPLIGRVALILFGPSLVGVRFFSALAQSLAMVLAGLITRELDGTRLAQMVTALAVALAPISLIQGALFQYVSFDYLWWVSIAYFVVRLLKSEDPRWWLGIGAAIGLGMMTKYTMAYCVAGVVGGMIFTNARRHLASPWLWGGAALSLLIFAPNLIWQARHHFISLEFLIDIHARDVEIGRTGGYLIEQFIVATNPFTVPLWGAGLYFYFLTPVGARYRMLGWMYVRPLRAVPRYAGPILLLGPRLSYVDRRWGRRLGAVGRLTIGHPSPRCSWTHLGRVGGWRFDLWPGDAARCANQLCFMELH
jgi:4-amino-4-deoxy-L-arabinose transferase-like glycosyltransferase